jgi:hypothetical protein
LPLEEDLRLARQVAEGKEAATRLSDDEVSARWQSVC